MIGDVGRVTEGTAEGMAEGMSEGIAEGMASMLGDAAAVIARA